MMLAHAKPFQTPDAPFDGSCTLENIFPGDARDFVRQMLELD
jgi:hypothetical protein